MDELQDLKITGTLALALTLTLTLILTCYRTLRPLEPLP